MSRQALLQSRLEHKLGWRHTDTVGLACAVSMPAAPMVNERRLLFAPGPCELPVGIPVGTPFPGLRGSCYLQAGYLQAR